MDGYALVLNAGSSSLKFSAFLDRDPPEPQLIGDQASEHLAGLQMAIRALFLRACPLCPGT